MKNFKEITDATILDDVIEIMKINRYCSWDDPEKVAQEFQDMIDYVEGKRKEMK